VPVGMIDAAVRTASIVSPTDLRVIRAAIA
jgi:hypothetical protein